MEKQLRSCLQTSPETFLWISKTRLSPERKWTKRRLKSVIESVSRACPVFESLPGSLHQSITCSLTLLHDPRRSSGDEKQDVVDELRILALICSLFLSHPNKLFSPLDLLPSVCELHDNLIVFEAESSSLSSEVFGLCELYWNQGFDGRDKLISLSLPFLLSRSLTLNKKVDVHRVYALRQAFRFFDFEDHSIEDLKMLLIRCLISPLYLKTEDGRRFLAAIFGFSLQLAKDALAVVKSQIPFGRKSVLEAYGSVLFLAWKGADGDVKMEIEDGFLQGLVESAIHATTATLAASMRKVLGGFISQRVTEGLDKLFFRLAEPVIFRSLQVANSNVRLNALHLLLDLFPLEDPDANKEGKDTLLDKQFFLMGRLLVDNCPDIRVVAVEGCCRVLCLFWEIIPSSTITNMLTKIFDDMSHDACNEVRVSTVNGVIYLLENPMSHEVLKVLLPRLSHLILDNVLSARLAVVDLLLHIRDIRNFQFNKVVGLDALLFSLANDHSQVAQKMTRLLIPSYFPSKVGIDEACKRCITLLKRSPLAGARLCEFVLSEGVSLKSMMELARNLINSVLSDDTLDADQIEGFLLASSSLCNDLARDLSFKSALKKLFTDCKVEKLFAAASSGHARSAVFNMFWVVCPDYVAGLVEECIRCVTNCGGAAEDIAKQAEIRSAHKLLLSSEGMDDMLGAFTKLLQKTAYRCHVKFGIEIPKPRASPRKRKKGKSSVKFPARWRHVSQKSASDFEEDYAVAVGIAWQVKDLLISEYSRKALFEFQDLEQLFLSLKVISEVSITQSVSCKYIDTQPVMAYASLSLHMTLQNIVVGQAGNSSTNIDDTTDRLETVLDQTANHLLDCSEKLLGASKTFPRESGQDKAHQARQKHINITPDAPTSSEDGSLCTTEKRVLNKVKMLTLVLKFIVDSTAMDFLSQIQRRCLKFASAYVNDIMLGLEQHGRGTLQFEEHEMKHVVLCLKSSFSYTAKLLHLVLGYSIEASKPAEEAFTLAHDLLNLIASTESCLGSSFAARLVAAAKDWLPDLILSLCPGCICESNEVENTYLFALQNVKLHFPIWISSLAKANLSETTETKGEEQVTESEEFPALTKLLEMMVLMLKRNPKMLDAVGVIFLAGTVVGLENNDFGLLVGLVRFVCVKLVRQEDSHWSEYENMLSSLPDIYPRIEREMEENDDDVRQVLQSARALLEPIWLYHVYETGRFSAMEE